MSRQPSTQECCWSLVKGEHHPSCQHHVAPKVFSRITINHRPGPGIWSSRETVTYYTGNGMNTGPRLVRNKESGHIRLLGRGSNDDWAELIMASERDAHE